MSRQVTIPLGAFEGASADEVRKRLSRGISQMQMSKLNIYRACVIFSLAGIVYAWKFAALLIAGWSMAAIIEKKIDPSHGKSSSSQFANIEWFGALSAWLGLWNGFYVWKDLDHDYYRRNRE
jgi:hypothetical protein